MTLAPLPRRGRPTLRLARSHRVRDRIDADAASQALWAAGHGITSLLILRPNFPWTDRDKLIGQVIDAAVNALLA